MRKCFIKKVLFAVVLILAFTISSVTTANITAQAAAAPSVKNERITLYTGYKSYKIKICNLSGNAVTAYQSSKKSVAAVTAKGIVEPVNTGTASVSITVKQNEKTYHFKVIITVKKPSISITQSKSILNAGDTYRFKARLNGSGDTIAWSVSDTSAASIDSSGNFTALKEGNVMIYAKAGSLSESCAVNILPKELSSEDIYAKCNASTMKIKAKDDFGEEIGKGFYIGDGKLVTNYHVIEGANEIKVIDCNKKEYKVDTILGYDAAADIAVLKLNTDCPALTLWNGAITAGEEIYLFNSPAGLTETITKGTVLTASQVINHLDCIQIDAALSYGNSGGPLVNIYGGVIGINTVYYKDGRSINYAVNSKELAKVDISKPISVAEYYSKYDTGWFDWFKTNTVSENPDASQDPNKCQEINSEYGVKGSITAAETGDYYYFDLISYTWFDSIFLFKNTQDMENAEVTLYKYNGSKKGTYSENIGKSSKYIKDYLEPGGYIIKITLPKGYTGTGVDYLFELLYK